VSLGRFEIDVVATEFGTADLRNKSYDGRAEALMAIAASRHQTDLATAWRDWRNAADR
jgi:acyl-CoA hydrolase